MPAPISRPYEAFRQFELVSILMLSAIMTKNSEKAKVRARPDLWLSNVFVSQKRSDLLYQSRMQMMTVNVATRRKSTVAAKHISFLETFEKFVKAVQSIVKTAVRRYAFVSCFGILRHDSLPGRPRAVWFGRISSIIALLLGGCWRRGDLPSSS